MQVCAAGSLLAVLGREGRLGGGEGGVMAVNGISEVSGAEQFREVRSSRAAA